MKRRNYLQTMALASGTALCGWMPSAKASVGRGRSRPNLLFIFPDQFRLHALGIWNEPGYQDALSGVTDPVHTPVLDQLAKESVLFTQAVSTHPVCSPYRAMLMSGMYPSRNGVMDLNCRDGRTQGLHHDITCFTDVLSDAGYATAYVGKTHWERTEPLFDQQRNYVGTRTDPGGHYANSFDTYIPPGRGRHGNDYWFQQIGDRHKDAYAYSSEPALVAGKPDGQMHRHREYTPKIEADIVVDYLENKKGQRDSGKPFSMIWAPNPPHGPYENIGDCDEASYRKHYKDVPAEELLNRPNFKASDAKKYNPTNSAPYYFSNVTGVDREIGRVLRALEASGEADNTIVVFTADHGEMMGSHGLMQKNYIYDESFLVPFMLKDPRGVKPRLEDLMLSPVDLMPTLLSMLGLKNRIPASVQGIDYSEGIRTGDYSRQPQPASALYLHGGRKGVRTDRYTYQVDLKGRTLLFDRSTDPYQMKNRPPASIEPSDWAFLKKELGRWLNVAEDPWVKELKFNGLIDDV